MEARHEEVFIKKKKEALKVSFEAFRAIFCLKHFHLKLA